MKIGRSRGVREERTEYTQLFSRTLAGSGLTRYQKVYFSTFDGKLEGDFITEWSQNLPQGPRPREQKLLLSILTYPIIHLKNRKNENQDLGFPNKSMIFLKMTNTKHIFRKIYQSLGFPIKIDGFSKKIPKRTIFPENIPESRFPD